MTDPAGIPVLIDAIRHMHAARLAGSRDQGRFLVPVVAAPSPRSVLAPPHH
jgi:hypothetical protein